MIQMQHLLLDDLDEGRLPGLHPGQLLRRKALVGAPLEGELGVQVFAHETVLELADFTEEIDKLFPALDPQRRLGGQRDLESQLPRPPRGARSRARG
jgi:hypothetical protein